MEVLGGFTNRELKEIRINTSRFFGKRREEGVEFLFFKPARISKPYGFYETLHYKKGREMVKLF